MGGTKDCSLRWLLAAAASGLLTRSRCWPSCQRRVSAGHDHISASRLRCSRCSRHSCCCHRVLLRARRCPRRPLLLLLWCRRHATCRCSCLWCCCRGRQRAAAGCCPLLISQSRLNKGGCSLRLGSADGQRPLRLLLRSMRHVHLHRLGRRRRCRRRIVLAARRIQPVGQAERAATMLRHLLLLSGRHCRLLLQQRLVLLRVQHLPGGLGRPSSKHIGKHAQCAVAIVEASGPHTDTPCMPPVPIPQLPQPQRTCGGRPSR